MVTMTSLSPLLKQATPVVVESASGCWITATDGRDYLDFTTGIGVTSTGHCHPEVVEAAREQTGKIIHAQYTTVMHKPLLALTEKLGEVLPAGLDSVFYANSGSEAVEAAIRLARMATGRPNIVVFQGGFHGRTVAAASLTTAGTKFSAGFAPLMAGVHMSAFPYAYRYGGYTPVPGQPAQYLILEAARDRVYVDTGMVAHVTALVRQGFYDGQRVHRAQRVEALHDAGLHVERARRSAHRARQRADGHPGVRRAGGRGDLRARPRACRAHRPRTPRRPVRVWSSLPPWAPG